jgi:hypothetical protein
MGAEQPRERCIVYFGVIDDGEDLGNRDGERGNMGREGIWCGRREVRFRKVEIPWVKERWSSSTLVSWTMVARDLGNRLVCWSVRSRHIKRECELKKVSGWVYEGAAQRCVVLRDAASDVV